MQGQARVLMQHASATVLVPVRGPDDATCPRVSRYMSANTAVLRARRGGPLSPPVCAAGDTAGRPPPQLHAQKAGEGAGRCHSHAPATNFKLPTLAHHS